MYNDELKERFLSSKLDNTARLYRYVLNRAEGLEEQLNKDICKFNAEEREMLLYSYSNKSRCTVDSIRSALSTYVNFCIDEGFVNDKINYFSTIGGNDLDRYVDKTAMGRKYVTLEDVLNMSNICINLQDILPIYLAFSGVLGEAATEIINLKVADLNNGTIRLSNREILIHQNIYADITRALDEKTYYLGNGVSASLSETREINQTPWVVRPVGRSKFGEIVYSSLLQRVKRVKQYYNNPYLTLKNMWFSGMIHDLNLLKNKNGEITTEDWESVIYKFNYSGDIIQLKYKLKDFI